MTRESCVVTRNSLVTILPVFMLETMFLACTRSPFLTNLKHISRENGDGMSSVYFPQEIDG